MNNGIWISFFSKDHQNRLPSKCIIQNLAILITQPWQDPFHFFYHFSIYTRQKSRTQTSLFWSSFIIQKQPTLLWYMNIHIINNTYLLLNSISCGQKFYLWSPITSKRWRCSKINIVRIGNSSSIQLHK